MSRYRQFIFISFCFWGVKMDYAEENIFKTSLIQEIEGISITRAKISEEIDLPNNYLNILSQSTADIFSNKQLYKENPLDQIKTIKATLSKIRNSAIRFKRFIESISLEKLNHLEKNELNHQLNEINTTLNIIKEKQAIFNTNTLNTIKNTDIYVKTPTNSTQISKEFSNNIIKLCTHNNDILTSLNYVYDVLSSTKESIERIQINISDKNNLNYIERFKEDTSLIIKKYENEIRNLTEKFENQYKKFELNQNKIIKSSELLSTGVDAGLEGLGKLNERTQKIELEFSKIIKKAEENVQFELDLSKDTLISKIDNAIFDAHEKSKEIETLHYNFKSLVEKAGIYDLTKNYKDKAEEEQKEYKAFRKFTAWSIIAAIVSTLLIFIIAFFEHYFSGNNNQTNYLLLASRLSISVMFFVLAFYLSKQAAKHYECYQDNHRTFLQLAALEPFMARMTPDEQKEIRKGLIPSYFNQSADGKFAAKADEVDMSMMFTFMDKLSNFGQNKKDTKVDNSATTEIKP